MAFLSLAKEGFVSKATLLDAFRGARQRTDSEIAAEDEQIWDRFIEQIDSDKEALDKQEFIECMQSVARETADFIMQTQ